MPHTFTDGKVVYSVDFMIAYVNIFKPDYQQIELKSIKHDINRACWSGRTIAPIDVLKTPNKYKSEYNRILNADLKYPIIIDSNGYIIDGVHRYVKALLQKRKTIRVYIFNKTLLKKCILNKQGDSNPQMRIDEYIVLFYNKFT